MVGVEDAFTETDFGPFRAVGYGVGQSDGVGDVAGCIKFHVESWVGAVRRFYIDDGFGLVEGVCDRDENSKHGSDSPSDCCDPQQCCSKTDRLYRHFLFLILLDDAFDCLGVVERGVTGHLWNAAGDVGGKEFEVHGLT